MMKSYLQNVLAAASLAFVTSSAFAQVLGIDTSASAQAVKQANAGVAQVNQRERPQWLEAGLHIVHQNEDCSAPEKQLAFATDMTGKLMACVGPQSKWTDAAPFVRLMYDASFSCGAGIPGVC
jgi:hypothetical protein